MIDILGRRTLSSILVGLALLLIANRLSDVSAATDARPASGVPFCQYTALGDVGACSDRE